MATLRISSMTIAVGYGAVAAAWLFALKIAPLFAKGERDLGLGLLVVSWWFCAHCVGVLMFCIGIVCAIRSAVRAHRPSPAHIALIAAGGIPLLAIIAYFGFLFLSAMSYHAV